MGARAAPAAAGTGSAGSGALAGAEAEGGAQEVEAKLRKLGPQASPASAPTRSQASAPQMSETLEDKVRLQFCIHDDQIRALRAAAFTTFLLAKSSEAAMAVSEAGRLYAQATRGRSPAQHGLGPPGPHKFAALLAWGAKQTQHQQLHNACKQYESEYWRAADAMERGRCIRVFTQTQCYDRTRLKWEFATGAQENQRLAADIVMMAACAAGGQEVQGAAPRGALINEISKR